jgi:dTDP-4-dehydrorhamnose reductase
MSPPNLERFDLELWGGIEATVNRVHERFFDQIVRTGHQDRIADLDLFADLGLRTLRYPILWERTAPDGIERAHWQWADERLQKLRELGIRPIVGLLHHGSGPTSTSLIDPAFPERLAEYAGAVARRYPWVTDYTPVNEPLTTARFAALYGHWYPHCHDDVSFARALLGQCRGTVLAMNAIRAVNPDARLIQTDDLGKTFSTDTLAYQADFENERRWITYDLLTGRLTPDHTMWQWLEWIGIERRELEWFQEHACPPDIIGVNTYLSSQRYLDHRIDRYPGETPGTNGSDTYVDVLAYRAMDAGAVGVDALLAEAWQRFGLPVAITEAHNGGSREEQLRWLNDVWAGAQQARRNGADVRAVTVWALLGLFDWAHLATSDSGQYEPGVFDIRGPVPRPTVLASMVRDLVARGMHDHPALDAPGWWRRPERFYGCLEGRTAERQHRHPEGHVMVLDARFR